MDAQSSKIKSFTIDHRKIVKKLKNTVGFEVNCWNWQLNDQTICASWGKEALFNSYETRLILEWDLATKIQTREQFMIFSNSRQVDEWKEVVKKSRSRKSSSDQRMSYMTASAEVFRD